jgi:phosphocarrier protein
MLEREVVVVNRLGLHMRAASKLVKTSERFKSEIMMRTGDSVEGVSTKSIFGVLLLAAVKGDRLLVSAEGDDEAAAIEAVAELFENGFYEE